MIEVVLLVLPESTSSLRERFTEALPGVIQALEDSGQAVDQENTPEAVSESGWLYTLLIEPGPATLNAAANTGDDSVVFRLPGEGFGQKGLRYGNNDEALWDRLEALR